MRIASTIGATKVLHRGETFTADDSGVLDVPETIGQELTAFPAWVPEHEAAAAAAAEQAAADSDLPRLAARIAELEAWRASLEAEPAKRGPGRPRKTDTDTE